MIIVQCNLADLSSNYTHEILEHKLDLISQMRQNPLRYHYILETGHVSHIVIINVISLILHHDLLTLDDLEDQN